MVTGRSPAVTLDAVAKIFPGKAVAALVDVSAAIDPGQFVAVIGKSGAGKTTLLRCLARAMPVSQGVIRFDRVDLAGLRGHALRAHRARVGMIYQQFNLVRRLRVFDNVLIGRLGRLEGWRRWAALAHHFGADQRAIALRCLDHVGLLDRVWQRTDTLSGGEQQRVAIAKILAQEPAVVLADEPVASLDLSNGRLVMQTLRRVASAVGITVVATLHHVEHARNYADRILGLKAGRLVFDGPAGQLTDAALFEIFGEFEMEPAVTRGRAPRSHRGLVSSTFTSIHPGPAPAPPPERRAVGRTLLASLALAVVFGLAARVVELRPLELIRDIGNVGIFLRGYLHPSFTNVAEYAWQCVVTVCIALWGTVLALVVSVPLGLLGARNLSPHPLVYFTARRVMDVLRAVNEFVFALMFVTAVGLGPFAGLLALGIHTGGVLGKLLSEAIEAVDPGQVEGVAAVGAGRLHVIAFGVVPQVLPNFLSYVLLRFESDIRSASVIGMVGGGGIGFYLWDTIRSFKDGEAATVILLIVAMVMCIDVVSARLRRAAI